MKADEQKSKGYCFCSILKKRRKKSKKDSGKGLTNGRLCSILTELSAREQLRWGRWSLKTIQNKEDKRETVIFTSHGQNKDSQFVHEFWAWRRLQGSIQDLTQEFDPGSGRTLAACLTHASRAGMWKSLLWYILAADGWVTREQPLLYWGITHRKVY